MWGNPQSPLDLVTFIEESLLEKFIFLGSEWTSMVINFTFISNTILK